MGGQEISKRIFIGLILLTFPPLLLYQEHRKCVCNFICPSPLRPTDLQLADGTTTSRLPATDIHFLCFVTIIYETAVYCWAIRFGSGGGARSFAHRFIANQLFSCEPLSPSHDSPFDSIWSLNRKSVILHL